MQHEDTLQKLIQGNSEANRMKWAQEWQQKGKKVIGVMSSYVPEEVILAAGMLPWRITGTWQGNVDRAQVYRHPKRTCPYCTHVLESFLRGELDFLDGIVIGYTDWDLFTLWNELVYLKVKPFCFLLEPPYPAREIDLRFFTGEIRRLISGLEDFGGIKISQDSLWSAIDTCNQTRRLLSQLYELRKKEIPSLSGAEVLGIITTAQVMPKEQFNQELESLLPYLGMRQTNLKGVHPRLLIESEKLDNPAYLSLVEEGCLVAMDDMDMGVRYFTQEVHTTHKDPAYALAKRYLSRHGAPRMTDWDGQIAQIIKWVREYKLDGVISLYLAAELPQRFRLPILRQRLDEAGIPNVSLEREYHLANVGQLRTRIGAFLEILSAKEPDLLRS